MGNLAAALPKASSTYILAAPATSKRTFPGLTTATYLETSPLPPPILLPAALELIGLSGKTLIQTLPPLLRLWVIARLPDSICLAVSHPRPRDLSPISPNAKLEPLKAVPLLLPLKSFLCFLLFGSNMFFDITCSDIEILRVFHLMSNHL